MILPSKVNPPNTTATKLAYFKENTLTYQIYRMFHFYLLIASKHRDANNLSYGYY
jgi:hypothetical protein